MRPVAVLALAAVLVGPAVAADGPARLEFASPPERALLVELFTSEGCSSCPPADHFLSGLVSDARLWKRIVPVAFHVDYWDYIGWKDRFARAAFSRRERAYVHTGHLSGVYTPGFVVGGGEWRSWYGGGLDRLPPPKRVGRLDVVVDGGRVEAGFAPAVDLPADLELNVALLGFGLSTEVRAGENAGRRLEHDFVVLGYSKVVMARDGGTWRARARMPAASVAARRTALAAWVSPTGDPLPIQATGGWLSAR